MSTTHPFKVTVHLVVTQIVHQCFISATLIVIINHVVIAAILRVSHAPTRHEALSLLQHVVFVVQNANLFLKLLNPLFVLFSQVLHQTLHFIEITRIFIFQKVELLLILVQSHLLHYLFFFGISNGLFEFEIQLSVFVHQVGQPILELLRSFLHLLYLLLGLHCFFFQAVIAFISKSDLTLKLMHRFGKMAC